VGKQGGWALRRRVALVAGAVFQILAGFLVPVGEIAGDTRSLVIPADYAFGIWGPIFVLCLICAVYGALPGGGKIPCCAGSAGPLPAPFSSTGCGKFRFCCASPSCCRS